jgi:hypothetical protein
MSALHYDTFRKWSVEVVAVEELTDEDDEVYLAVRVRRVGNPPPGCYAFDVEVGDEYLAAPSHVIPLGGGW